MASQDFRWQTVEGGSPQPTLFDLPEREVGIGEYRGLEFLHVRAKRIINEVGPKSPVPFNYTINAYRGCSHACTFCLSPETPILMADGRTLPIALLSPGRSHLRNRARRQLPPLRDHDGARQVDDDAARPSSHARGRHRLLASGDHRFLTGRGWKHVTGTVGKGPLQRPHLTLNNALLGTGRFAHQPKHDDDYRRGYLCGMIRGDGHVGH